ncbi:MAG: DUF3153 domain-containing protein [Cyanobium sp. LacPavin_0818_WC50_MAG_67_9]|nr:DUF3153 domain-containing protein [Cyanobium sp. LacPavin_0818_WC50_MAG_67_9]
MPDAQLAQARDLLERGDYGRVVRLLEPLSREHPPASQTGAEIQLLLATAWMGQGEPARAMVCCRLIKRCRDATLRAQAEDLLMVLEAPALERPREWSITLPDLGTAEAMGGQMQQLARQRRRSSKPPPPPPPPVGPTQAPIGFAVLAIVLLLLTVLLGGCMEVRTEVTFQGPGRLQIAHTLVSPGPQPSPWQRQFSQSLQAQGFHRTPAPRSLPQGGVAQRLASPVLAAPRALALLTANLEEAARLGGLTLPPPTLQLDERNWLVGVWQTLELAVDLREIAPLPGVSASVELGPVRPTAVQQASPDAATPVAGNAGLVWPLRFGARNSLRLHCWRWSSLGLGGLLITAALALVLALERLRRLLGFGLPELPV